MSAKPAAEAPPPAGHSLRIPGDPLGFFASLPERGDLVRVRLGLFSAIVVCDAALARTVLLDDRTYDKGGPLHEGMREVLQNGLLTCSHDDHRRQRKLVQPAFRRDRMPGYSHTMTEHSSRMIASWSDGQVIDVRETMLELATRVVAATLFSGELSERVLEEIVEAARRGVLDNNLRTAASLGGESRAPDDQCVGARLRSIIGSLVATSRAEGIDRGALMSSMLRSGVGDRVSDDELVDQAITFFAAGTETTATLMTAALHLVAHDPDLQQRLAEEARDVLSVGPMSYERLVELPYVNRVITETLRLYPPVWLMSRVVTLDTRLGGQDIPAGTNVLISPYLLHHRPDLFPDPDTFDPDREIGALRQTGGGFVAFGVGPRKCVGDTFARVESALLLALLAARWRILPVPSSKWIMAPGLTLALHGLRLQVVARPSPGFPRPTPEMPATTSGASGEPMSEGTIDEADAL